MNVTMKTEYRSYVTIMNILKLRCVKKVTIESIEDFVEKYYPLSGQILTLGKPSTIVTWCKDSKLGKANLQELLDLMENEDVERSLVVSDVVTPSANSKLSELEPNIVTVFSFGESTIDIFSSRFTPPQMIISQEEKEEVMTTFAINKDQMPKVSVNGPVSRRLGAKVGDVIKVIRPCYSGDTKMYHYNYVTND